METQVTIPLDVRDVRALPISRGTWCAVIQDRSFAAGKIVPTCRRCDWAWSLKELSGK